MKTLEANSTVTVACHLQTSVSNVERIANRLRLNPVLVLDNVRHYSDEQIERIRHALRGSGKGRQ